MEMHKKGSIITRKKMKNSIKKLALLVFLSSFGLGLSAQESSSDSTKTDSTKSDNNIKISFGKTKVIIIKEDKDGSSSDTIKIVKKKSQRHNHFAGVDLGVNGLLSPNTSTDLQKEAQFLELNYAKSIEVGINVWEKYMPIAKEKFGVTTGLGVKYNNYDLEQDVLIINKNDKTIATVDTTRSIKKNKFKSTMLHVPLMLETNIGKDADHSFHLAVGGTVSYRLASKTKQKYTQEGNDFKKKDRNDFNMNPFRFAAVARVGYGDFTLYASYSLTPLFDKDKGPEVYPFTVGLSLVSF